MANSVIERDNRDASIGWVAAIIIVLAVVILGGLYIFRDNSAPGIPNTGTENNIDVTVPTDSGTNGTGGTMDGTY